MSNNKKLNQQHSVIPGTRFCSIQEKKFIFIYIYTKTINEGQDDARGCKENPKVRLGLAEKLRVKQKVEKFRVAEPLDLGTEG